MERAAAAGAGHAGDTAGGPLMNAEESGHIPRNAGVVRAMVAAIEGKRGRRACGIVRAASAEAPRHLPPPPVATTRRL